MMMMLSFLHKAKAPYHHQLQKLGFEALYLPLCTPGFVTDKQSWKAKRKEPKLPTIISFKNYSLEF